MARVINITDKFAPEEGVTIKIGDKEYVIDNTLETVFAFEELSGSADNAGLMKAMKAALGEKAANELKLEKLKINQFKALVIAITAALQDIPFEEAEKRFRKR